MSTDDSGIVKTTNLDGEIIGADAHGQSVFHVKSILAFPESA